MKFTGSGGQNVDVLGGVKEDTVKLTTGSHYKKAGIINPLLKSMRIISNCILHILQATVFCIPFSYVRRRKKQQETWESENYRKIANKQINKEWQWIKGNSFVVTVSNRIKNI